MQSLLESLHTHHVLCELEGLAVGLDGELSTSKETAVSSAKSDHIISPLSERGQRSPGLVQQLLLICNVAFVAHGQKIHGYLCVLLVGLPNGSFVGLELDDVNHFVQGSQGNAQRVMLSMLLSWEKHPVQGYGFFKRLFSDQRHLRDSSVTGQVVAGAVSTPHDLDPALQGVDRQLDEDAGDNRPRAGCLHRRFLFPRPSSHRRSEPSRCPCAGGSAACPGRCRL